MPKQCQIVALLQGKKTETEKQVTEIYKLLQKEELFYGRVRRYQPFDEESNDRPPDEQQILQKKVVELMGQAFTQWMKLWDLTLTQDVGNTEAKADIVVNEKVLAKDVPISTLLFLEKQLTDVKTFIGKLPTPLPTQEWKFDGNINCLKTDPIESLRTKKIPRNHVKAEATDRHPAQVEVYYEDVPVGRWSQVLFSGCCPQQEKDKMLERVKQLHEAVISAREKANTTDVTRQKLAESFFDFITTD